MIMSNKEVDEDDEKGEFTSNVSTDDGFRSTENGDCLGVKHS